LTYNCQKIYFKKSKLCRKVVKKLSKNCQKIVQKYVRFSIRAGGWKKQRKNKAKRRGKMCDNIALTGMAWNGGGRFCPDWNSLDWSKSVLA
jgi:hypothetical protein